MKEWVRNNECLLRRVAKLGEK